MIRVGINGFGRIGRAVFRIMAERGGFEVTGLNDLTDAPTLAHLLKYDSTFGRFKGKVEAQDGAIVVNGRKIPILAEKDPTKIPWKAQGAEIVVESTGVFRSKADCEKHIAGGA